MKRYAFHTSIIMWATLAIGLYFLMGCATTQDRAQFYQSQTEFLKMQMEQVPKPLFEMKAVSGKAIENLESIVVYVPRNQYDPKDFKQFSENHPGWETLNTTIRTAGNVVGLGLIIQGVKGLADSIGSSAGHNTATTNTTTYGVTGTNNSLRVQPVSNIVTGNNNTTTGLIENPPSVVVVQPSYPPVTP